MKQFAIENELSMENLVETWRIVVDGVCENESKIMSVMNKEYRGIISIKKAAGILGVTVNEALYVLNALVDKGYLVYEKTEYRLNKS